MTRMLVVSIMAVGSLFSLPGKASTVTIDFEEFALGDGGGSLGGVYDPDPPYAVPLVSEGYEISGAGRPTDSNPFYSAEVTTGTNTGGSLAYGAGVSGLGQDGYNYRASISIDRVDGGVFAIHSLDLFLDSNGFTDIRGILSNGAGVSLTGVTVGTGDWLNLKRITFSAEGDGFGPGYGTVEVDNIAVSAVPVPAAVWLFGSALAGLGWVRKRSA